MILRACVYPPTLWRYSNTISFSCFRISSPICLLNSLIPQLCACLLEMQNVKIESTFSRAPGPLSSLACILSYALAMSLARNLRLVSSVCLPTRPDEALSFVLTLSRFRQGFEHSHSASPLALTTLLSRLSKRGRATSLQTCSCGMRMKADQKNIISLQEC